MGLSNIEDILQAGLDGETLPTSESRIAELLKEWIEQGGNIDDILVAGANITLTKNSDGTITIAASGEVSAEDTVARAEIAAIKDGETLDSFGDVETALGDKADTSTTYTKTEVDTALSVKANSADVYSKTAVDTALSNKADKSTTYTKTEVDTSLDNKADKSTTYTKTEVDTALGGKVDKETGKGLSTNDYTTDEKTKLASIAEGAEVNEIEGIKVNNTSVNPDANKVVNITVPTSAADVSALSDTTKYAVALSLTINSSTYVMTGQLKDQNGDNLGTAQTIDLPLESVVVGGSYNSQTKKVVLTLQNGNTIEFSVADLVSGLQTELSASNKLNPAYINYDSTHRAVSDTEKSTWNGKQSALTTAQLAAVNSGIDTTKVAQIETNKNNILMLEEMNGAKNLSKISGGSRTGVGYFLTEATNIMNIAANTPVYMIFDYVIANGQCSMQLTDSAGQIISGTSIYTTEGTTSGHKESKVTPSKNVYGFNFYSSSTGNITISNIMIVPANIYEAGFTDYQPYAMSNAELTAAIQALQAQLANQ